MCYIDSRKGENNRPQGVDQITQIEIPPSLPAKYTRVVFLCPFLGLRKRYLRLLEIKVSNARTNIPNAIRSLKSKLIRTTSPPMYDGEANALAVTRLFSLRLLYHVAPVSAITLFCSPYDCTENTKFKIRLIFGKYSSIMKMYCFMRLYNIGIAKKFCSLIKARKLL